MLGELDAVEGRWERLRFALGCVRVAVAGPVGDPQPAPLARAVIVAVVAAVFVFGLLVEVRALRAPAVGQHGAIYEGLATGVAALVLLVHGWSADRRAHQRGSAAERRFAVAVGVVVGTICLAVWLPVGTDLLGAKGDQALSVLVLPFVLITCAGVTWSLRRHGSSEQDAGRAGNLVGQTAAAVAAVGLLSVTCVATRWFSTDPPTVAAFRDSWSAAHYTSYHTHFRLVSGYVTSENLDTALIVGLVLLPLVAAAGSALGSRTASPSMPSSHENTSG
jgi:uncharacterized membrane protein